MALLKVMLCLVGFHNEASLRAEHIAIEGDVQLGFKSPLIKRHYKKRRWEAQRSRYKGPCQSVNLASPQLAHLHDTNDTAHSTGFQLVLSYNKKKILFILFYLSYIYL